MNSRLLPLHYVCTFLFMSALHLGYRWLSSWEHVYLITQVRSLFWKCLACIVPSNPIQHQQCTSIWIHLCMAVLSWGNWCALVTISHSFKYRVFKLCSYVFIYSFFKYCTFLTLLEYTSISTVIVIYRAKILCQYNTVSHQWWLVGVPPCRCSRFYWSSTYVVITTELKHDWSD